MNLATDKMFELKPPVGVSKAKKLVSGKMLKLNAWSVARFGRI